MKPDFSQMSKAELKAYVLEHRDDLEAIRDLFSRRTQDNKRFPPLSQNGIPVEENINIMKAAIQEHLEKTPKTEE